MIRKGFPVKFVSWVMKSIKRGKVAVRVNDIIGPYFESKKGLRQGDPISPILFDIAIDVLTLLIKKACENGLLEGVLTHLVEGG
jgi:retron-type reverse transcriptase